MRIQLHHNYETTLIQLSTQANLSPTDFIKMLLLDKAGVPHQFKEAPQVAQDTLCIIKTNSN